MIAAPPRATGAGNRTRLTDRSGRGRWLATGPAFCVPGMGTTLEVQVLPRIGHSDRSDRFVQQAVLQVLQPLFDPTFSPHSYGFRPQRSAHQAVKAAREHVQEGRRVVVDVDLSKFFDQVIHLIIDNLFERTLLGEITRAEGLKYIDSMVRTLMHGLKKRDTGN